MSAITNFSHLVYQATKKIPKGRVSTYALLAHHLGNDRASRAVGNALNKNPYAPIVPCHRVVKSTGELGGFASGPRDKKALLEKEGVLIKQGRVLNFAQIVYRFGD